MHFFALKKSFHTPPVGVYFFILLSFIKINLKKVNKVLDNINKSMVRLVKQLRRIFKIMETKTFIKKFNEEIKKGEFVSVTWQSEKVVEGETFRKLTNGVVRFVKYGNINGVEVKGKVNPNENVLIPNVLYENTKTGNILVQMATTKVKSMVKYFKGETEITKEEYEENVAPRKSNGELVVFRVNIKNLLKLGK